MNKILITGGAGFIGFSLAQKLSEHRENDVSIIDNLSRGKIDKELQALLKRKNVHFIQGDLTDLQFLLSLSREYEYIFHLAAIIGLKNVIQNADKVLYVNALATLNMFEYAKNIKNLKRIFFSSTSEVYSGTAKHFNIAIPTDENVPLTLEDISLERTTYALSKMYGESIGFIYGKKFGIPVTIGRYHNVYGPRMGFAHVIPETFLKISQNGAIDVPSLHHTRAFCFIDDAIEFTIRACYSSNTINEILHIGNSKEEISIRELVLKISNIMGRNIVINSLPDTSGSVSRRCPDTTKIERLTGFSPKVFLSEGLRRTYEWYKDKLTRNQEYEFI